MKAWFADLLAASRFLARYPQHAAAIAAFEPMATREVRSMAVARHWNANGRDVVRLYVNVDWVRAHPHHFSGVLLHEIHHVLCGHLDDVRLHRATSPRLMECAMEMAANEHIVEPLPGGVVRWQDFAEFGVVANQSTPERYALLARAEAEGRLRVLDEAQMDALDPHWRRHNPGAGGSAGGQMVVVMPKRRSLLPWRNRPRVVPSPSDEHRPGARGAAADRGLGDALDRASDQTRARTWSRSAWLGEATDAACIAAWQVRIRAHLRGEAGGSGDSRGDSRVTKEIPRAVAFAATGELAWPHILRLLLRSPPFVQPTRSRPNRRFPSRIGEIAGRVRRSRRPRLLVGIDTSASMDAATLGRAITEIERLRRHADCTIAEVDAAVQRVHRMARVEMVVGGGDTAYAPLFGLVPSRHAFDGIVYITDGGGAWPAMAPAVPVLWVLTTTWAFDCPWGTVVRLPPQ